MVTEELLAAGAPVGAHWIADRQTGRSPCCVTAPRRRSALPAGHRRGESFFCIGMSEPDAGSDLAGVRTAPPAATGWSLSGQKSGPRRPTTPLHDRAGAHLPAAADRQQGLSQVIVDLSLPA